MAYHEVNLLLRVLSDLFTFWNDLSIILCIILWLFSRLPF